MTSRRVALKAIAAAMMSPLARLRASVDREALMLPFCMPEDGTGWWPYMLRTPFMDGSLCYATDRYKAVRAVISMPEVIGKGSTPPVAKLFDEAFKPKQWFPVERPGVSDLVCDGQHYGDCPVCFGELVKCTEPITCELIERYHRLDIVYEVDTHAHGDTSCPQCHGKWYRGPHLMQIGESKVSFRHAGAIFGLPSVEFAASESHSEMVLFRADGFEGMVGAWG